jgi:hypothetical protein
MIKLILKFVGTLLVIWVGTAFSAIPNTTDFLNRTSPMISGTVFSVDDRQIVVDTDQEQRVTLVMDSRTMLPVDLAPGMVMRAEFRVMENGQYYVNRITPIRDAPKSGVKATSSLEADHALNQGQTDMSYPPPPPIATAQPSPARHDAAVAQASPGDQPASKESDVAKASDATTAMTSRVGTSTPAATTDDAVSDDHTKDPSSGALPRTAGSQPLVLLLGLLAVTAGGALMLKRRLARS